MFNFGDDFDEHVVAPYVDAHAKGLTPNPCIECNRSVKFARLAERAELLGFDAVATGHHARIKQGSDGRYALVRGADAAKDQSYVLHMLNQTQLARTMFPVGGIQKSEVRELAAEIGLRTADKPDSQDVCFITSAAGRTTFLGERILFRPGRVVDTDGAHVGDVESVEMVTVGQRKGLGLPGGGPKRYVINVDIDTQVVTVGHEDHLLRDGMTVSAVTWVDEAESGRVLVQCSAHGEPRPALIKPIDGQDASAIDVVWDSPQRRIAPGQSVVFYNCSSSAVLGGGIAG